MKSRYLYTSSFRLQAQTMKESQILSNQATIQCRSERDSIFQRACRRRCTVSRLSSERASKRDAHPAGGSSGGIFTAGSAMLAGRSMSARLKFLPHALHMRRARHLLTSTCA